MLGSVITAMVTPLRADGAVDFERFRELATNLVENGSDGLVVCGTTGESPTLSDAEKLDLFRVAVDEVGGRAVLAGLVIGDAQHVELRVLLDQKAALLEQIRRDMSYKAMMDIWLYVHVPFTFALLAALIAHIISVFFLF